MSDYASLELRFKVGVLKELYKRNLITREEQGRAIKAVNGQHGVEHTKK
jgi:hypothetical protein